MNLTHNTPYMHKKKFLCTILTLALLMGISSQVFAFTSLWNTPQTLDTGDTGYSTSLTVVNGAPAVSYYDNVTYDLRFIRAADTNGTAWNTPITVASTGDVGVYNSLEVVNGFPAISYYDYWNGDLLFIRATDANGTAWNAPITLDSTGDVGMYNSLAFINGFPAVSYYDFTNGDLKFIIAAAADGTTWNTPMTLDSTGNVGSYTSLGMADGRPVISYYDATNGDLKYMYGSNALGTVWDPSMILDNTGNVGSFTSLALLNDGSPAVSYYDTTNSALKFVRATDGYGYMWGLPLTLDDTGNVGSHTSLAVMNGVPAISYVDSLNGDLKFIQAMSTTAATWNSPETLDTTSNAGNYNSMAVVNGELAISYHCLFFIPSSSLRFIRRSGTYNIFVRQGSTSINSGDEIDFGTTALGVPITRTLTIRNTGTLALDLHTLSLPAGFSLTGTYPKEVAAGSSGTLAIRLDALQTGTFSGNMQIGSADTNKSPFNINLTGIVNAATGGEIAVTQGGSDVPDGTGSVAFGSTLLGTPVTRTFTVANSGSFDINLYSLSLPNGFSVSGSYNSIIPAGSTTDIIVQLDAATPGSYSGQFSLANNDADENPYNFTLSGVVSDTPGEISVWNGAVEIPDGTGTLAFGSTPLGTPLSITLAVHNDGTNPLDLGTLSLPAGFSLGSSYDSSVNAGAATPLTIRLDALGSGSYSGTLSLPNDDTDENPFNFTLSGTVTNLTLQTPLIAPVTGSTVLDSDILVAFNQDVLHDGSVDAGDNPDNYLLVEAGNNATFETTTCLLGQAGDDVRVAIGSVTYDSASYTAVVNTAVLPSGSYQLLVCGTASIQGLTGNVLNNGLSDSQTRFTVVAASNSSGSGGTSSTSTAITLPATGFAPGRITLLAQQPAQAAYSDMDSLRLQIPSLKVDMPIVGVPQTSNGWDVTWLTNTQAGWLNGTAFPTWLGNTVLTGHVTDATGNPGPFAEVKTLAFGDEIILQAYGETHRYEVRENRLVLPENSGIITEHLEEDWITLVTCEGYDKSTGKYLFRRVVRAVLVEVE
jgi:LPXTG-site transpeptidase (sortase) family protein